MAQTSAPQPQGAQDDFDFNSPSARVLLAAAKIIYTNPKPFLDIIRQAPDPQQGIVRCVEIILKKIAESVKGVPPEAIQQLLPVAGRTLGPLIGQLLAELAHAAGLVPGGKAPAGAPPAAAVPTQPGAPQ